MLMDWGALLLNSFIVQQFAHERLLCCLISIFGPSPIGIRYLLPRWAPLVAE